MKAIGVSRRVGVTAAIPPTDTPFVGHTFVQ
jgi:hypothetical protein